MAGFSAGSRNIPSHSFAPAPSPGSLADIFAPRVTPVHGKRRRVKALQPVTPSPPAQSLMKLLLDLLPVILFFAVYQLGGQDIYRATAVLMVATVIVVGLRYLQTRKLEWLPLASLGLILVFGGATLLFHDPTFVKLKPTVLYVLFALVFVLAPLWGGKTLVERLMAQAIQIDRREVWQRVNVAWVVFFLALAGLNAFVAFSFPEPVWVQFKLYGLMGLTFLFVIAQALYLGRHASIKASEEAGAHSDETAAAPLAADRGERGS